MGSGRGGCSRCKVFQNEVRLTEAYIVAPEPSGPRGGDPLPLDQREDYENYILLCPNCHSKKKSKMTRRYNGEGTVAKRRDGRWGRGGQPARRAAEVRL